jgi:uncharacterized protein (DUF2235 family)
MAKQLIICCDGTGNEVEGNISNVLKLYRLARKSSRQRVYYSPGIGTIGHRDAWTRLKQNAKAIFGLATGYGVDRDILGAYAFICTHYVRGDSIFLFGFSRGAYTVRALAGLIHLIGVLPRDQLNLATYALTSYKRASEQDDLAGAWDFSRIVGARRATIDFVGVWDTVASVIVPRRDRILPTLQMLPYTRTNPSVRVFRHAMAIDEKRRMFRVNHWRQPQPFIANRFDKTHSGTAQDIKQVWFAGVHSDVGGGYPEEESGLAKFPLEWMIEEAAAHGLEINRAAQRRIVFGENQTTGRIRYVVPDAAAAQHESLTTFWNIVEWIPKAVKWREWPRPEFLGCYVPRGEPRMIAAQEPHAAPVLHRSVIERMEKMPAYRPVNLPEKYTVEQGAAKADDSAPH